MDNWTHFLLVILAFLLFSYGASGLRAYEHGQLGEESYWFMFASTTAGFGLFTNSTLTLYIRCEREFKSTHTK